MKKFPLILLLVCILLISCNLNPNSGEASAIIKDALGRDVSIKLNPDRIIIAGRQTPMLTHFFYMFETAGEKIAAIENRNQSSEDFISLFDPSIQEKYLLERGASVEQISPFKPDVVVLKSAMRESVGQKLEEINIPVVYVDFESVDDVYRDLMIIAQILGEKERGEFLVNEYKRTYAETNSLLTSVVKPTVLLLQVDQKDQSLIFSVPDSNWLQTDLVERVNATPVWKGQIQGGGWSEINAEQIALWDPDFIFVINYQGNAPNIIQQLKSDSLWVQLDAVKNDQIFPFIYDYISWDQPDPRWVLGYTWMAFRLYPSVIPEELVRNQIEEFFNNFYFIEDAEILEQMKDRLSTYFE